MEREHTGERFPVALGRLLAAKFGDQWGQFSFESVLLMLEARGYTFSRSTVRRQARGEYPPQPEVMEAFAAILDIDPDYFLEYRVYMVSKWMQEHPRIANQLYETARVLVETEPELNHDSQSSPK